MITNQEAKQRRQEILDTLHDIEKDQMEHAHAWNKCVHAYRRHRRKLLDELGDINQALFPLFLEDDEGGDPSV